MKDRGWSAYKLSKEAGFSDSAVSNLFARNNLPTIPTLEALCKALGITLSQFFGDEYSVQLDDTQKELFDGWVTLTGEQRELIMGMIKNFKKQ